MSDVDVVHVLRMMLTTALRVAGPLLLVVLVVGVVVSLFQVVTQVQEQAVVYVLKFAAVGLVLLVAGPWMIHELASFFREMWTRAAGVR